MMGEAGELADAYAVFMALGAAGKVGNAVKKYNRVEDGMVQAKGPKDRNEALADCYKEIGDTAIYLDLVAKRLGTSLEDCVRMAFNQVSEREGFPERI